MIKDYFIMIYVIIDYVMIVYKNIMMIIVYVL